VHVAASAARWSIAAPRRRRRKLMKISPRRTKRQLLAVHLPDDQAGGARSLWRIERDCRYRFGRDGAGGEAAGTPKIASARL
jgi:hypothetical protein